MAIHEITVRCRIQRSFAVEQVRAMFDLADQNEAERSFRVELPDPDESWQIGMIVGPSGSGKTTVARSAYGASIRDEQAVWDRDRAVIDQFGETPIKQVVQTLTSVGFSSPPSWLKPYHVLSNGERFRCDLARALLSPSELVAFDEFTSVVDRNVARIGSAAVAKSIRKGQLAKRFVAITCHYDVIEWLEPDWVLDMASLQLARGRLWRRPPIDIQVHRCRRETWELFRHHHYLNTSLMRSCHSFVATWRGEPVGFSAWTHMITSSRRAGDMREHRTVVLPDYQGIGIGNRLSEFCASIYTALGGRAFSTTSHPAMIHYRHASPLWRLRRFGRVHRRSNSGVMKSNAHSRGRVTGGFQYVGPPLDIERARAIMNCQSF